MHLIDQFTERKRECLTSIWRVLSGVFCFSILFLRVLFLNNFLWYLHITYFRDTQQLFLRCGLIGDFYAIMRRGRYGQCCQKSFNFFQKWTVVLGNCDYYLPLVKSPEFMTLSVSEHVFTVHKLVFCASIAPTF